MQTLIRQFLSQIKRSKRRGRSGRGPEQARPRLEGLEGRELLSTLYLVPKTTPVDPTHFHTFQGAYQAAAPGDVIQVEPGASVAATRKGTVGNRVAGGSSVRRP